MKKFVICLILLAAVIIPLACGNSNNAPSSPIGGSGSTFTPTPIRTNTPGGPTATSTSTNSPTPGGPTATPTPTFAVAAPVYRGSIGTSSSPNQLYYNSGTLLVAENGVVPVVEDFTLTGASLGLNSGTGFVIVGYPTPSQTPAWTGVTVNLVGPQGYVNSGANIGILDDSPSGGAIIYVGPSGGISLPITTSSYGSQTLSSPKGLAADSIGNIYVADTGNHEVDFYTANGFPGSFTNHQWNGSSSSVTFKSPYAITCDASNNVWIADDGYSPSLIQEYSSGGVTIMQSFNTVSGCLAHGMAVDSSGNVYVTDVSNNLVEEYALVAGVWSIQRDWGITAPLNYEFNNFTPTCIAFTGTYILVGDAGSNNKVDVFQ